MPVVRRRLSSPARSSAARAGPASARSSACRARPPRPTPPGPRPRAAADPIAERRLVSILFADLVGFTSLAEGRDAEETRELLAGYFELAREVVHRHGGLIEKFIGDAVMAVWGAPIAREDDAERAVRAALDLVDAVHGLGPAIEARAGVLTGEAAVTLGATDQGIVAGDLVNTASRLQAAAPPGAVLVGEATQRAASRAVAFEAAGDQALRGKALPVPAWRALRVVARVGGRDRGDLLEAPFVGRDDELRFLKDLYHATTREKRARLVSVFGPAGIGKTRLAREFLHYVDGLAEDVWWHEGRCPAYGEGISFWALGEMVRRRCGLVEADDEATTRARVAATLAEHVPDPDERRWLEEALLALLGFASRADADELFGAWRTFFERLAASFPVVLVFEDFHFADSGLLDFVDHLLEWSRGIPIYVLTLARPELLERRPGLGRRQAQLREPEPGAASRAVDARAAAGPGPRPARAGGEGRHRPRRRDPAVRGRDGADAPRRRPPRAGRRRLPADRRPGPAGGARVADGPDRQPPGRPGPRRSGAPPDRRRPRPELRAGHARRGQRARRGRASRPHCGPSSAARCWWSTPIRGAPSAASTRSSRR